MFELLGITLKDVSKSYPEVFADIPNSGRSIPETFKGELEKVTKVLESREDFQITSLKQKYSEHLKYQSEEGRFWLENFIGHHINNFTESSRRDLIRRIAIEIVIGRNFTGFDINELSLQFATMYNTGIIYDDDALASPRAYDKIIAPMAEKEPEKLLSDVGLTVKDFKDAQKFRNKEELLDVEMIRLLMFGHKSKEHGLRPIIVFTCEKPDSIKARIDAAAGFLEFSKDVHKKTFLPGEVYCLDCKDLKIARHFNVKAFINRY